MARLAGVNIPDGKRVEVALTYIYGIGPTASRKLLATTKISPDTRVKDLTEAEMGNLRAEIDKHYQVEGDLTRLVQQNIKRLRDINAYRGLRHKPACRSTASAPRPTPAPSAARRSPWAPAQESAAKT